MLTVLTLSPKKYRPESETTNLGKTDPAVGTVLGLDDSSIFDNLPLQSFCSNEIGGSYEDYLLPLHVAHSLLKKLSEHHNICGFEIKDITLAELILERLSTPCIVCL